MICSYLNVMALRVLHAADKNGSSSLYRLICVIMCVKLHRTKSTILGHNNNIVIL